MKITILFAVMTLSLCSVLSADMQQTFSSWVERSRAASDDSAALTALLTEVTITYPDANERLASFYNFAMGKHDSAIEQQARMTLATLWSDLAPPDVRARFLNDRIGRATPSDLSALKGYLEKDIVKPEAVTAVKMGTIVELVGSGRERLLSPRAYRSINAPLPARIVALLFELTPASVVLDLAEHGERREVVDLVERAESARHRFEEAVPSDKVAAWDNVQSVLRHMLELNSSSLDGYVARVMTWRQNGPNLLSDPVIINTLRARNDPVVNYLLSGKGLMSLLDIDSSETALFGSTGLDNSSTNGESESLHKSQQPRPKKAPEAKPATTSNEEPASSTPWSIIAVLVVVATGSLWLLFKARK